MAPDSRPRRLETESAVVGGQKILFMVERPALLHGCGSLQGEISMNPIHPFCGVYVVVDVEREHLFKENVIADEHAEADAKR